jgi:hypothetical protein
VHRRALLLRFFINMESLTERFLGSRLRTFWRFRRIQCRLWILYLIYPFLELEPFL